MAAFDIIYRYDPARPRAAHHPVDAADAQRMLEAGNREFTTLTPAAGVSPSGERVFYFDLEDLGIAQPGSAPKQQPFAVVLGCSDARVPTELIFNQGCNDMFVVRVAGNVLGREGLGSVDYAIDHLGESLRLLVVLGHSQCGAVSAAVEAFLKPSDYLALAASHTLRAVVNGILPAVRTAALALEHAWGELVENDRGYRSALTETSVVLNAALGAAMLEREFVATRSPDTGLRVVFGVYDLVSRCVGVPLADLATMEGCEHSAGLMRPPSAKEGFSRLARQVAASEFIKRRLVDRS
jgi:carbonic anhydrase